MWPFNHRRKPRTPQPKQPHCTILKVRLRGDYVIIECACERHLHSYRLTKPSETV